jgi:mycoredoxin-dependent peroxiredoxin
MANSHGGPLKPGDRAPDFDLYDQNGRQVKLADYRGKKTVVLAFYVRAFTSGCTREMKAYQADIPKFEGVDTQVIGISVDSEARNKAYAESLGLTFPVVSDPHRTVSRQYGVLMPVIRWAKRVTFIIDKEGIIQSIQRGEEAINPSNAHASCARSANR